jgi:hypothetical protein
MKKFIAAIAGVFALGAVAVAQVIGIPLITTSHPFTDLVQVLSNGSAQVGNTYTPWSTATHVYGYYKSATTLGTGFVYTFPSSSTTAAITYAQFANAGAASGYVYLENAPVDGALDCFFSIGGSASSQFAMYAGNASQTLNNGITTLTALTQYCYLYSTSNTSWDRVK